MILIERHLIAIFLFLWNGGQLLCSARALSTRVPLLLLLRFVLGRRLGRSSIGQEQVVQGDVGHGVTPEVKVGILVVARPSVQTDRWEQVVRNVDEAAVTVCGRTKRTEGEHGMD